MNIVVVEDSPVMQRLLLTMVAAEPELQVVGVAAGESEAIDVIGREQPDIVLLDLHLSPGHGWRVLQAVRAAGHHCKVLILTSNNLHEEYVQRGLALGVVSFHDKGDGLTGLQDELKRLLPSF